MSTLTTKTNINIPVFEPTIDKFLDRTTVLYGPSGSGKTVYVKYILDILRSEIDQVCVISPSEQSNKAYEGIVHPLLIHDRLWEANPDKPEDEDEKRGAIRFLKKIWDRQDMASSTYNLVNQIETLRGVYQKLPAQYAANDRVTHIIAATKSKIISVRAIQDSAIRDEKTHSIKKMAERALIAVYKKQIIEGIDYLPNSALTEQEAIVVRNIKLNPRLLIIFDDCAAMLKPMFNREIFKKLFYQNRHSFISVIVCCQDDSDLPPHIRKNTFTSIYTHPNVCTSNFERRSNGYSKTVQKKVLDSLSTIFVGHRKMVYLRDDPSRQEVYHTTAKMPPRKMFGSAELIALCNRISVDGCKMDRNNPYFKSYSAH